MVHGLISVPPWVAMGEFLLVILRILALLIRW